jgi:hypothetical protein
VVDSSSSCPAFSGGKYNASYGFQVAADTFYQTFLPKVTERINKFSDEYEFTGIRVRGCGLDGRQRCSCHVLDLSIPNQFVGGIPIL